MNAPEELPKETVLAWRKFLGTKEGQYGIGWLRQKNTRILGETDLQIVGSARKLQGYLEALSDVEDELTRLPVNTRSLDEAPLSVGRDE